MFTGGIDSYFEETYSNFLEEVSQLSSSDSGKILVEDDRKLYCFDKISEQIYENKNGEGSASADAVYITKKRIVFVEFKSGFKRKITKDTLNPLLLACPYDDTKTCKEYGKMLLKIGKKEVEELLDSLKMKAIESYITLITQIIPLSGVKDQEYRFVFCVITDDYVEKTEDIMNELSGISTRKKSSNTTTKIRDSQKRFAQRKTADGKNLFYDEVKVFSPHEFKSYLNKTYIEQLKLN
ncbi:MAG: hypothetical protein IKL07_08745 [Clostridium sp.]|nr:hypothetical protein [Clostridium sp.]